MTSFLIVAITTLLIFLFYKFLFKKSSIEFQTFMTFMTIVVIGLLFINFNVEVLPIDLVYFSVSLLLVYIYFTLQRKRELKKPKEIRKIEKLSEKIYNNRSELFKKINKSNSLDDYFFLKMEYEKGNVMSDKFQSKYKSFYNMYVFGFTDEFFERYFELLNNDETNLKKILKELSKIKDKKGKKSVQLAFASKLIHTVDAELPLYNSAIATTFNLAIPKGSIEKKINSSIDIYNELKSYHGSLSSRDLIRRTIKEFRNQNDFKEGILSDAKLIDLLIRGSREV